MDPNVLVWLYSLMIFLLIASIPVVIILKIVGYVAKKTKTNVSRITKY